MIKMEPNFDPENGIVVILDALGASSYKEDEVKAFMQSRRKVIKLLSEKVEDILDIDSTRVKIFTFNDTIIVTLMCQQSGPSLDDAVSFFTILRKFLVDSMQHKILFRGAISIGSFYANDSENIVMGQSVTDAAAWYDKADWIGVHATPRATIVIHRLLELGQSTINRLMLDYDVPLKDGKFIKAKAINWPKVFYVKSITPCPDNRNRRAKLLEFLSLHRIPFGAESKYHNAIAFYDYAIRKYKEEQRKKK